MTTNTNGLSTTVIYTVHSGHEGMHEETKFAGLAGRVHPDGTADLIVFPPNREPRWVNKVPFGEGPGTFTLAGDVTKSRPAPSPLTSGPFTGEQTNSTTAT